MTKMSNTEEQDKSSAQQVSTVAKRRDFLKKATVGAAIATIPSHSVWAGRLISGNMSGNVSGWAQEGKLATLSHGYYKTHIGNGEQMLFSDAFGGEPIENMGEVMPAGLTLLDVMNNFAIDGDNGNKSGGPGMVNAQLATMYLNAKNSGGLTYWPVVNTSTGPFYSLQEYGAYLYDQARNPTFPATSESVGEALDLIINQHHA